MGARFVNWKTAQRKLQIAENYKMRATEPQPGRQCECETIDDNAHRPTDNMYTKQLSLSWSIISVNKQFCLDACGSVHVL